MRIWCLMFVVVALSSPARTQERPPSNDGDELRNLGSTLDFIRTRNAPDYAISMPNGIDEASYLKIGGIEQWVTIRGGEGIYCRRLTRLVARTVDERGISARRVTMGVGSCYVGRSPR